MEIETVYSGLFLCTHMNSFSTMKGSFPDILFCLDIKNRVNSRGSRQGNSIPLSIGNQEEGGKKKPPVVLSDFLNHAVCCIDPINGHELRSFVKFVNRADVLSVRNNGLSVGKGLLRGWLLWSISLHAFLPG